MPRTPIPLTTLAPDASQFGTQGPLQTFKNLAMREPGLIEPLPGRLLISLNSVTGGYAGRRVWGLKTLRKSEFAIFRGGNAYSARSFTGTTAGTPTIASATLLGEPSGLFEARERAFYAGPRGALVFDEAFNTARMLGMQPPTLLHNASATTTDAQALPANAAVNYRATLHRKETDGYEIVSAPSYVWNITNTGPSILDLTMRIGWVSAGAESDARVRAGDIVKLWRTRSVAAFTSPNDTFHLAMERVVTSANITARYMDIRDTTPDTALVFSEELYTNPGQQGALEASGQVGASVDAAFYGGHAFYAATDLPSFIKLRINTVFGALSGAAQNTSGIGERTVIGTVTNGSPTITDLSAAELVGLTIGQTVLLTPNFTAAARITAVDTGAGTVTVNENSVGSSASTTVKFSDVIRVNGSELSTATLAKMLLDAHTSGVGVIITPGQPGFGDSINGLDLFIQSIAPYGQPGSALTIAATNGDNYSPRLPAWSTTTSGTTDNRTNRLLWSKLDQPDHVPASHELTVGKGEITRLLATQDRLLVFCTDGLYAVTGNEFGWSVDLVDRDLILPSQQAADEMNGVVYAYAKDRGLLRIERSGAISNLSKGAIQSKLIDPLVKTVANGDGNFDACVACDPLHDEIGVFFLEPVTEDENTYASYALVLNERTQSWRTQTPGVSVAGDSTITAWAYSPRRRSLVWAQGGISDESDAADLYQNLPDDNLATPIPGATLQTYPYVPDGDPSSLKRFHEIVFTLSAFDTAVGSDITFNVSVGGAIAGGTTDTPKPLAANAPADTNPTFFQLRHMVTRQAAVAGHIVVNFAPNSANVKRWRLHAVDVAWEPASARTYNR